MGLRITRDPRWQTANQLLPVVNDGRIANGRREKWGERNEKAENELRDMSHLHLICGENHVKRMRSIRQRNVLSNHRKIAPPTSSFPSNPIVSPAATIISITSSSDCALSLHRSSLTFSETSSIAIDPSTTPFCTWKRASEKLKSMLPLRSR